MSYTYKSCQKFVNTYSSGSCHSHTPVNNNSKWGSVVEPTEKKYCTYSYDEKFHKENPFKHYSMILERTGWLNSPYRSENSKKPSLNDHPSNFRYIDKSISK